MPCCSAPLVLCVIISIMARWRDSADWPSAECVIRSIGTAASRRLMATSISRAACLSITPTTFICTASQLISPLLLSLFKLEILFHSLLKLAPHTRIAIPRAARIPLIRITRTGPISSFAKMPICLVWSRITNKHDQDDGVPTPGAHLRGAIGRVGPFDW